MACQLFQRASLAFSQRTTDSSRRPPYADPIRPLVFKSRPARRTSQYPRLLCSRPAPRRTPMQARNVHTLVQNPSRPPPLPPSQSSPGPPTLMTSENQGPIEAFSLYPCLSLLASHFAHQLPEGSSAPHDRPHSFPFVSRTACAVRDHSTSLGLSHPSSPPIPNGGG